MATGTVVGIRPGVDGGYNPGSDDALEFNTSRIYRVQMDEVTADVYDVLQTPGLPTVNLSVLTQGPITALCKSKNATQDQKNRRYWEVTCRFDTSPRKSSEEDGSEEEQSGDPTAWIPRASISWEQVTEYLTEDVDGNAWVNSAGCPFSEGFASPVDIAVWTFTQYEPVSLSLDDLTGRNSKVNDATWRGYAAKTWLCNVVSAELGVKNGFTCWKVNYRLKYKSNTWVVKVLDTGPYYLNGSDEKIPFLDEYNNRIYDHLDGEGGQGDKDFPEFIEFNRYDTEDFSFVRVG